tara:strand:+ start:195 stop:455 length:261 start_codon:yes stop_codon:yes gene_type:complete
MIDTLENLRSYKIATIPAFDEDNAIGSHFVGWQCGFEPTFVEVQFCMLQPICPDEAIEIAEEHMEKLDWKCKTDHGNSDLYYVWEL